MATTAPPTLPPAPATSTVSPARNPPWVNNARYAVAAGCTTATAVTGSTPAGSR
jgi:hypothetical protein